MNASLSESFRANILVICDAPDSLHEITTILSAEKYHVRALSASAFAQVELASDPPDVILLDIPLSSSQGDSIFKRLKSDPIMAEIRVMVVEASDSVASNQEESRLQAFENGAVDFIARPFHPRELIFRVENQLKFRELQRLYNGQNVLFQREVKERQQAEIALSRRADEMAILYQSSLAITSGLELSHVLATLHDQIQQVLPADVSYVALYAAEQEQFQIPVYYERGEQGFSKTGYRSIPSAGKPGGFASYVIQTRKTFYVPNVYDPNAKLPITPIQLGGQTTHSYLGIPLIWKDQVIGVLSAQAYEPNAYTPEHIRLAEALAMQASIAIQNAYLYDQIQQAQQVSEAAYQQLKKVLLELEKMANTDKLTGAYNRYKFDEIINKEMRRAHRYGSPLTLIIFDIDHFKNINDAHGHHIGDHVLRGLVHLSQGKIRDSDTLARWGGEEFIILTPGNDIRQAAEMAERLRIIVQEADFSPVSRVTISLGVSEFQKQDTQDSLIRRADDALYRAKHKGRNRVEVGYSGFN